MSITVCFSDGPRTLETNGRELTTGGILVVGDVMTIYTIYNDYDVIVITSPTTMTAERNPA